MDETKPRRRRREPRPRCLCGTPASLLRGEDPVCHGCAFLLDYRLCMEGVAEASGASILFPALGSLVAVPSQPEAEGE